MSIAPTANARCSLTGPGRVAQHLEDTQGSHFCGVVAHPRVPCDLDVLDPRFGRVNPFAVTGGFDVNAVESAVKAIGARMPVAAAAVTAYAPECDVDGTIREAAFRIIDAIVNAAAR